jgi:3-oxoacyl-[acyl-carrier protein] reductase
MMNESDEARVLAGRVAIVTGATGSMGAAVGRHLADLGAAVGCLGRSQEAGTAVAAGIEARGGRALFVRTDVTSEENVRAAVERVAAVFGRIDVLVNIAAGTAVLRAGGEAPVVDEPTDVFDRMMRVNVYGPFWLAKYAIPYMRRTGAGSIISISSIGAHRVNPSMPAYAASKAGLEALTRQIATDYAGDGIRANSIILGSVSSADTAAVFAAAQDGNAGCSNRMLAAPGTPDDVANLVGFLASDQSRYITAASVPLDGGALAVYPAPIDLRQAAAVAGTASGDR